VTKAEVLAELRVLWRAVPKHRSRIERVVTFINEPEYDEPVEDQGEHLRRVGRRIARYIGDFFRAHAGQQFHMDDLRKYVQGREPNTSPDSPSRIMRDLRQRGRIDYEVVSRKDSLYLVKPALTPAEQTSFDL